MSINFAEDLLRRYNARKSSDTVVQGEVQDNKKRLGTWSYANTYDALYDKYSKDKNFNLDMWHEAIKRGEQDTYLGFIEQNKDNDMALEYYDPGYYNYESMMLELYKSQADNTNKEERFHTIYDPVSNSYIEESLGEMTDREHIQYQLNQIYANQKEELDKQAEQWKKDQLSFWQKLGHDTLATLGELGEGLLSGVIGVLDFVAAPFAATGMSIVQGDNWFDNFVDYFGDYSLTSLEKKSIRAALDEYERTHTHFRDIDGNMKGVGTYVAGVANSIGMMIPAIITTAVTAGAAAPVWLTKIAGTATFYTSIFTGNMYENATNEYRANSPSWLKIVNAGVKSAAEAAIEYTLGKFLGGTVQNALIGISGKRVLTATLSKAAGLKYVAKSALQEGLEEFLQDFGTNLVDQFTSLIDEGYANTGVTFQTLIDSFLAGALSSVVMSGGTVGTSAIRSAAINRRAKAKGEYDTVNKIGPGDIAIEVDGKVKKLKGFTKLYYSSVLNDFKDAVDELKKSGLKSGKSIKLAQEIYGALDVMSQYYASFDKDRIIACERLLSAVISEENSMSDNIKAFTDKNARAGMILSDDTINAIVARDKSLQKAADEYKVQRRTDWANYVEYTFTSMVGEVAGRLAPKVKEAAKEAADELAEGGVTKIYGGADKDGGIYESDDIREAEKIISGKGRDTLSRFAKDPDFEFIFTTDGHVAVEKDKFLFVPVAWLENYTASEIYETLERSRALGLFMSDKEIQPFVDDVTTFVREFTKQKHMSAKTAFMQLLFNESVYQGFLLSGENGYTHRKIVYRLAKILENYAKASGYLKNARRPDEISAYKQRRLRQVTDAIKMAMRPGTIKAIINWGFDPQEIGADAILLEKDKQLIREYKRRREVLRGGGTRSAHAHLKEDIIKFANFTQEELDVIERAEQPDATDEEKTTAFLLLHTADEEISDGAIGKPVLSFPIVQYDFAVDKKYNRGVDYKDVQHVNDILFDFERLYGVSAFDIMAKADDFPVIQYEKIHTEMSNLNIHNIRMFVRYKLESMLGDDYSVYMSSENMSRDWSEIVDNITTAYDGLQQVSNDTSAINDIIYVLLFSNALTPDEKTSLSTARERGDIETLRKFVLNIDKDFIEAQDPFIRNQLYYTLDKLQNKSKHVRNTVDEFLRSVDTELSRPGYNLHDIPGYTDWRQEAEIASTKGILPDFPSFIKDFIERLNIENRSNVHIMKSIPADKLFLPQIISTDLDEQNYLIKSLFADGPLTYDARFEDFVDYDNNRIVDVKKLKVVDLLRLNFDDTELTARQKKILNDCTVTLVPTVKLGPDANGLYSSSTNEILLFHDSHNLLKVLSHEVNHLLQFVFGLPNGFNGNLASKSREFLEHVYNNYRTYVKYYARSIKAPIDILIYLSKNEDFSVMEQFPEFTQIISYCAYKLVQGELWADFDVDSGKLPLGYIAKGTTISTADRKEDFLLKITTNLSTSMSVKPSKPSKPIVENALVRSMINVLEARTRGDTTGRYHTALSRINADDIIEKLVRPDISPLAMSYLTLDEIIKNPDEWLSDDVMKLIGTRFDEEGVVYSAVRTYVEQHFKGISVDRTGDTHRYIFVDDNAFDDLLTTSTKALASADNKKLSEKYINQELPLSMFYKPGVLNKLGIGKDVKVIIGPTLNTEFVVNKEHKQGIIFIQATDKTSASEIIDKLNHEFRHLLQVYNNLETGFTPDIEVTPDMIKDVRKHVPELFTDERVKTWVKALSGGTDDANIVRYFIYTLTGGELNAYGIQASLVETKPVYVVEHGDNLDIFMPWYYGDKEGRYSTKYKKVEHDRKEKLSKEEVEKILPQGKTKTETNKSRTFSHKKAEGTNLKYFEKAGKRNQLDADLQDFVIATTGFEKELEPALWDSIKKGTLNKQRLFRWFRETDTCNEFTFSLLNKYVFKNDYITSFEQLNELLSGKKVGKGLVIGPALYWATAAVFLEDRMQESYFKIKNDVDTFLDYMTTFANSNFATKIRNRIAQYDNIYLPTKAGEKEKYDVVALDSTSPENAKLCRILAMENFDGSLGGAFKMAFEFRDAIKRLYLEERRRTFTIESNEDDDKDNRGLLDRYDDDSYDTLFGGIESSDEMFKFKTRYTTKTKPKESVGNSIIEDYKQDTEGLLPKMLDYIIAKEQEEIAKRAILKYVRDKDIKMSKPTAKRLLDEFMLGGTTLKQKAEAAEITWEKLNPNMDEDVKKRYTNWEERWQNAQKELKFYKLADAIWSIYETSRVKRQQILEKIANDDKSKIVNKYDEYRASEAVGVPTNKYVTTINGKELKSDRNSVQNRIGQQHRYITKQLKLGVIKITNLPDDVRIMFDEKTFEFKKEFGQIGRLTSDKKVDKKADQLGKKAFVARGFNTYEHKWDINAERQERDLSKLYDTEEKLRRVADAIKIELRQRQENYDKRIATEKKQKRTVARLQSVIDDMLKENQTLKAQNKELKDKSYSQKIGKKSTKVKKSTKSKKSVSNVTKRTTEVEPFNILSNVAMPKPLVEIFNTSFDYMADTLVQWASKDADGKVFDKNDKEFKSRLQHELITWDKFYELNAQTLGNLTYTDVVNIIDFFYNGNAICVGGPQGKFNAFEIFVLAYIMDVGRRNVYGWNLSEKTISAIESMYESKASALGSGLNAVSQVQKMINPFKKVQQRMLDEFNIQEEEFNPLINAVESFQKAKTDEERIKTGLKAVDELKKLEELMIIRGTATEKSFWDKVQSWRYMSMLSSPATWARNTISNTILSGTTKFADAIGGVLFKNKDYREGQWNLTKVQTSDEVKKFIDNNVLNNPLFTSLYKMQGKYEARDKNVNKQRELFVELLVKALREKYMVEHRFDGKLLGEKASKFLNDISVFVNNRISDERFIKSAATTYFGKILTIEVERGNVDLSKGFNDNAILDLFADAVLVANEDYMHKRSFFADMVDNLRDKHPYAYHILHTCRPFLNSSFNWFVESLKYSPIGLAKAIVRSHNLEKRIAKLEADRAAGILTVNSRFAEYLVRRDFGKGTIGVLLWIFGLLLGRWNIIRIDEDEQDKTKFYLYIGNIKIDISDIFGTSSLLAGGVIGQTFALHGSENQMSFNDFMNGLSEQMFKDFVLSDIVARHRWDEGPWDGLVTEAESVVRSFVPQAIQFTARLFDNRKIKYTPGVIGALERTANSFGFRFGELKIDPYTGNAYTKYAIPFIGNALASGFFLGAKFYWTEVSEQEMLADELGMKKGQLTGELTIDSKKYFIDDVQALQIKYGQLNGESLSKIKSQKHSVEMPNGTYKTLSWDDMSDKQRRRVIERTMTRNAEIAKIYMWTQKMGKKFYASDSLYALLKKLGITKNVYRGDKGFVV